MRKNLKKGFTLVELLVVIAIIGLLASVVIVSVGSARAKARDSRRISDAKAIQAAMELYKDGNNGNSVDPATSTLTAELVPTYIGAIPTDPKTTNAYVYTNAGADESYALEIELEQAGALGDAGFYCANSTTIEASTTPAATGGCTER